jgi:hypothetical protein
MNGGSRPEQVSDFDSESDVICPLVTMGDYFTNWPCMSTGVMFVRATQASRAAINAMVRSRSFFCYVVFSNLFRTVSAFLCLSHCDAQLHEEVMCFPLVALA